MARQVAHTPTDFFAPPPPMIIEEEGKDKKTKKQRKRHNIGLANRNTNIKKNTRQRHKTLLHIDFKITKLFPHIITITNQLITLSSFT